ncbi:MAG: tRNA pseudouridine(13) synthase TruD [bacterium]
MNFNSAPKFLGDKFPCLTAELPGTGGFIKQRCEDFIVEEQPLYKPSGEGTHLYFEVRKEGLSTLQAVKIIARSLDVKRSDIGFAGNKDSQAVTRQIMSVEHLESEEMRKIDHSRLQIKPLAFHKNKLRTGHLSSNRFEVKIRNPEPGSEKVATEILEILANRGVPNYYGNQRFGRRADSAKLGEALVKNRLKEFVRLYLGCPSDNDPSPVYKARCAFERGDYDAAFKYWPKNYTNRRNALAAYVRSGTPGPVLTAIPKRQRRLFVSAFQSLVFNLILAERMPDIDKLYAGDIARKEDSGGIFRVDDPGVEQPRVGNFEISPTGPVFGSKCWIAEGKQGEIERKHLARFEIEPERIKKVGSLRLNGTRRSLRFEIKEATLDSGADEHGKYLQVSFTAPPGSYATLVLREIIKF